MSLFGDKTGPKIDFLHGLGDIATYFTFICNQGITSDQMLGLAFESEEDAIRTVYASHRLDREAQGTIPYESSPEVLSNIPVNYLTLFETTKPVLHRRKYMVRLASILNQVRNRAGRKENEIYCAGQMNELSSQYLIIGTKRYLALSEPSSPGITSVRYDGPRKRFIGIRSDSKGFGVSLACVDCESIMRYPDKLQNLAYWNDVLEAKSMPFLSLSRQFALHKGGCFMVNCVNDERAVIAFDDEGSASIQRTFYHPTRIIGAPGIPHPGTVVTYLPKPNGTSIQVLKVPMVGSPLSPLLL